MSLPANFLAALGKPGAKTSYWIEIEGLPYAYGTRAATSAFWSSLPASDRFEAIRPYLPRVPSGVDARLDPLEGMASPGEFRFEVVDVDGFLTQAANIGREDGDADALWLSADYAPGQSTLSVGGALSNWPTSGTGYIGRSTFSYTGKGTGTLTGVTMGKYRSQDAAHAKGEPVTRYPQHLGQRRAWFYLLLDGGAGFWCADRVSRYAGAIEDYELTNPNTWALIVRTPEKELGGAAELFRDLRSGKTRSGLPRVPGFGSMNDQEAARPEYEKGGEGDPGVLRDESGALQLDIERLDKAGGGTLADGEWVYFKIDEEILKAQWSAALSRFTHVHRGLFGSTIDQHQSGVEWQEGVAIVGYDANGGPEARHSRFMDGDRPEDIVLQLLCGSAAPSVTLGDADTGATTTYGLTGESKFVRSFVPGSDCLLSQIRIRVASAAPSLSGRAVLYSDAGGPSALIAATEDRSIGTGIQEWTFGSQVALTAGTKYWLGLHKNAPNVYFYTASGGTNGDYRYTADVFADGTDATWSGGSMSSALIDMEAVGSVVSMDGVPDGWHANFARARVDVASFEAIRDTVHATDHLCAFVAEPTTFRDLVVEHILKPFGLYLVHGTDDKLRLRHLKLGAPASPVATIDKSVLRKIPQWKSGTDRIVGEYRLEADLDPSAGLSGDPSTVFVDVFADAKRLYGNKAQPIVHRSIFSRMTTGIADPAGTWQKGRRTFDSRRAYFLAQFGKPPPVVSCPCLFSVFPLEPGDPVAVDLPELPSLTGAGRGYTGPAVIVARRPVDLEAGVDLELYLLGASQDRFTKVCPSAEIASLNGSALSLMYAAEAANFQAGDVCRLVSADFSQTQLVTIASITGLSVLLNTTATVPGAFLCFGTYDEVTADQRARGAWFAYDNETIGNDAVRAYRYAGI